HDFPPAGVAFAGAAFVAADWACAASGARGNYRTAIMAAKVVVEAIERRIMGASLAHLVNGLLAQRPIQQLLREFRALVFQEPGILLHTAIQRHADLPGP